MIIRRPEPQDHDDWRTLWDGYNTFYERTVVDEVTLRTWDKILNPEIEPFAFVAVADESVIGFAHYWFHESTSDLYPRCYLQDLFVLPSMRGQRIGEKLINTVCDEAVKHKSSELYWLTQEFNKSGRALYDRVGMLTPFIKYRWQPTER